MRGLVQLQWGRADGSVGQSTNRGSDYMMLLLSTDRHQTVNQEALLTTQPVPHGLCSLASVQVQCGTSEEEYKVCYWRALMCES